MGLSGRQLLLMLREKGLGYRTQTFYNDYRIVRESVKKWENMKYIRKDRLIPEHWYSETLTPLETNYQTTFEIEAFDIRLNTRVTRYVTVGHDTIMRRADLERLASSVAQGTSPTLIIERIIPTRALRSPVRWV